MLAWQIADAVSSGTLTVERVAGPGWVAHGIAIDMDLFAAAPAARVQIERLQFGAAASQRSVRGVTIECGQLSIQSTAIACSRARIDGTFPSIGRHVLLGTVRFDRATKDLALALANIKVGGGIARASLKWGEAAWSGQLRLQRGELAVLRRLLADWATLGPLPSLAGTVDLNLDARGESTRVLHADWRLQATRLDANNSAGTLAGEQLSITSQGSLTRTQGRQPQGWRFKVAVGATHGQAYAEPVFVDLAKHPLAITAEGRWLEARRSAVMDSFTIGVRRLPEVWSVGEWFPARALRALPSREAAGVQLQEARILSLLWRETNG